MQYLSWDAFVAGGVGTIVEIVESQLRMVYHGRVEDGAIVRLVGCRLTNNEKGQENFNGVVVTNASLLLVRGSVLRCTSNNCENIFGVEGSKGAKVVIHNCTLVHNSPYCSFADCSGKLLLSNSTVEGQCLNNNNANPLLTVCSRFYSTGLLVGTSIGSSCGTCAPELHCDQRVFSSPPPECAGKCTQGNTVAMPSAPYRCALASPSHSVTWLSASATTRAVSTLSYTSTLVVAESVSTSRPHDSHFDGGCFT